MFYKELEYMYIRVGGGWRRPLGRHEKKSISIYRMVKLAEWETLRNNVYYGGQGGNPSKLNYSTIR